MKEWLAFTFSGAATSVGVLQAASGAVLSAHLHVGFGLLVLALLFALHHANRELWR